MQGLRKAAGLAAAVTLLTAGSAQAATLTVDDDGIQCPAATFSAIQPAIDAAAPGDRILVCDGVYEEALDIGAGKDNVRLTSLEIWGSVVRAPTPLPDSGAIVHIHEGVRGVRFDRFTVEGPGNFNLQYGILVDEEANAAGIADNRLRALRNNFALGNSVQAIQVGMSGFFSEVSGGTSGSVGDIARNRFQRYLGDGVDVTGEGSSAVMTSNTFDGLGEQSFLDHNGIDVNDGAWGRATGNRVTGHSSHRGGYGIRFDGAATGSQANNNYVDENDTGIGLLATSGALVKSNTVPRNDEGITVDEGSTGNRFERNDAKTNLTIDCRDDTAGGGTAGTANTWLFNKGVLATPPGICTP